jgi:hypothetical protein
VTVGRRWAPAAVAFVLPFLVALMFQLALPSSAKANESTDYTGFYLPVAERVADGDGLTTPDGAVADRYPPGYPVVLAGVIRSADAIGLDRSTAVTALGIAMHALGTLFLFGIARTFLRPWVACVGALAWGLSPVALWLTKQPNSELVFSAIVLGALLVFVRLLRDRASAQVPRLAAVGALLGTAALIRPIAIGIVVPLAVTYLVARRRTAPVRSVAGLAVLTAAFVVVLVPWELHVYRQADQVVLLSTGSAVSIRDGLTFETGTPESGSVGVPGEVRDLMHQVERDDDRLGSGGQIASYLGDQARARPATVAQLGAIKVARSWFATESERYEVLLLAFQVPFLGLAAFGLSRTWRHGSRVWAGMVLLLVAYFWLMTVAVLSIVRYMTIPEALLAPFFVLGLQAVVARLTGRFTTPPWRCGATHPV